MDLFTHTYENIPEGWNDFFQYAKEEVKHISDILEKEREAIRIVPEQENILKIFHLCKPENVSVIIVGQDPYPQILSNGTARAQGLSFSVSRTDSIPSSLQNIYKEIKNCYPDTEIPTHGDISHWVPQGVFLLNTCLTCQAGIPNSHCGKFRLWCPFINKFIKYMAQINKNLIWVLWGNEAQKTEDMIGKAYTNILKSVHPSGLSASRGFFGCNHFKIINDILKNLNKPIIKWLPQVCKNKNEVQNIINMLNSSDLEQLETYYTPHNELGMESKMFTVSTFMKNLQIDLKLEKMKEEDFYKIFIESYSKYNNLNDTYNFIKSIVL
jgi:uracil-DNA glycosylase